MISIEDKARLITSQVLANALQIYKDDTSSGSSAYDPSQIEREINKQREVSDALAGKYHEHGSQQSVNSLRSSGRSWPGERNPQAGTGGALLLSSQHTDSSMPHTISRSKEQTNYLKRFSQMFANITSQETGEQSKVSGPGIASGECLSETPNPSQDSSRAAILEKVRYSVDFILPSVDMSTSTGANQEKNTPARLVPRDSVEPDMQSFKKQKGTLNQGSVGLDYESTGADNSLDADAIVLNSDCHCCDQFSRPDGQGLYNEEFVAQLNRESLLRQGMFGSSRQLLRQNSVDDSALSDDSMFETGESQCFVGIFPPKKALLRLQSTPKLNITRSLKKEGHKQNVGGLSLGKSKSDDENKELISSLEEQDKSLIRPPCVAGTKSVNLGVDDGVYTVREVDNLEMTLAIRDEHQCSTNFDNDADLIALPLSPLQVSDHVDQRSKLNKPVKTPLSPYSYVDETKESMEVLPRRRVQTSPTLNFHCERQRLRCASVVQAHGANPAKAADVPQTISSAFSIRGVQKNVPEKLSKKSCAIVDLMITDKTPKSRLEAQGEKGSGGLSVEDSVLKIWGIDKAIKCWKQRTQCRRQNAKVCGNTGDRSSQAVIGKNSLTGRDRDHARSDKSTMLRSERENDTISACASATNAKYAVQEENAGCAAQGDPCNPSPDSFSSNIRALIKKWGQISKSGRHGNQTHEEFLPTSVKMASPIGFGNTKAAQGDGLRGNNVQAMRRLILGTYLRVVQAQLLDIEILRENKQLNTGIELSQDNLKTFAKNANKENVKEKISGEATSTSVEPANGARRGRKSAMLSKTSHSDSQILSKVSADPLLPSASKTGSLCQDLQLQFKVIHSTKSDELHGASIAVKSSENLRRERPGQEETKLSLSSSFSADPERRLSRCLYGVFPSSDDVFLLSKSSPDTHNKMLAARDSTDSSQEQTDELCPGAIVTTKTIQYSDACQDIKVKNSAFPSDEYKQAVADKSGLAEDAASECVVHQPMKDGKTEYSMITGNIQKFKDPRRTQSSVTSPNDAGDDLTSKRHSRHHAEYRTEDDTNYNVEYLSGHKNECNAERHQNYHSDNHAEGGIEHHAELQDEHHTNCHGEHQAQAVSRCSPEGESCCSAESVASDRHTSYSNFDLRDPAPASLCAVTSVDKKDQADSITDKPVSHNKPGMTPEITTASYTEDCSSPADPISFSYNYSTRKSSGRVTPYARPKWTVLHRLRHTLTSGHKARVNQKALHDGDQMPSQSETPWLSVDGHQREGITPVGLDAFTKGFGKQSPVLPERRQHGIATSLWLPGVVSCAQAVVGGRIDILAGPSTQATDDCRSPLARGPQQGAQGSGCALFRPPHPRIIQLKAADTPVSLGTDLWPAVKAVSQPSQEHSQQPQLPLSDTSQSHVPQSEQHTGPQPQPQRQQQTESRSQLQTQSQQQMGPQIQPQLWQQTQPQAEPQPQSQRHTQLAVQQNIETQLQQQTEPQTRLQLQRQFQLEIEPRVEPTLQSQEQARPEDQTQSHLCHDQVSLAQAELPQGQQQQYIRAKQRNSEMFQENSQQLHISLFKGQGLQLQIQQQQQQQQHEVHCLSLQSQPDKGEEPMKFRESQLQPVLQSQPLKIKFQHEQQQPQTLTAHLSQPHGQQQKRPQAPQEQQSQQALSESQPPQTPFDQFRSLLQSPPPPPPPPPLRPPPQEPPRSRSRTHYWSLQAFHSLKPQLPVLRARPRSPVNAPQVVVTPNIECVDFGRADNPAQSTQMSDLSAGRGRQSTRSSVASGALWLCCLPCVPHRARDRRDNN